MPHSQPATQFTFEPLPWQDPDEGGQWHPSVRVMCAERFVEWTVMELGFDDPRFTEPYSRALLQEIVRSYQLAADRIRENMSKWKLD